MSDRYDAVIVGARVAGSMTAIHLARLGHRVLVLDRAGPPGDTLSTHALLRTAVLQLKRASLMDAVGTAPPLTTMRLGFDDAVADIPVKPEHGVDALFAPRRTVLDQALLEAAARNGVEVELGTSVKNLIRDNRGRVAGVEVTRGNRTRTPIEAALVVGADGRHSTVAALTGSKIQRRVPATSAGVYTYYEGVPTVGFDFRFRHRMMSGALATNDGLTLLSASVPTEDLGDPSATFDRVFRSAAPDIAEAMRGGRRVERFRFTPGIESFIREPAGPGWLLVGDAGFTKDPLSAHGIACAFRDAELAAVAAHTTLSEPASEEQAGTRYRSDRDRFAVPLLEHTAELAAYRWDATAAAASMKALGTVTDEECAFLAETATTPRRFAA